MGGRRRYHRGTEESSRLACLRTSQSLILHLASRLRSWAGSACTSPIFAEVVPSQLRSLVYSFDRAFEAS